MSNLTNTLQEAKARLDIPTLWTVLNLAGEMPRNGVGLCRSPFRPDNSPSFSIFDAGRTWKDQGTGDSGDAIDFLALAEGREGKDCIRRFLELAGMQMEEPAPSRTRVEVATFPDVSTLHRPTDEDVSAIARLRRLDPEAVQRMANFGILRAGAYRGLYVWALVDGPRGERPRLAEVRTYDGSLIPTRDCPEGVKSLTLRGSRKDWPIGASLLDLPGKWTAVLFCEGMPDLLAAAHFAHLAGRSDLCPVAMLGRSVRRIHDAAVSLLTGKRIRCFAHSDGDGGGRDAMARWIDCIPGAEADVFSFDGLSRRDGKPVNDLNDAAVICPAQESELTDLLP